MDFILQKGKAQYAAGDQVRKNANESLHSPTPINFQFTYADLFLFVILEMVFEAKCPTFDIFWEISDHSARLHCLDEKPFAKEYYQRVRGQKIVQDWLQKRPKDELF